VRHTAGHTALHWAAAGGHDAAVRWLLRAGVPADAPNFAGASPLHSAVNNGHGATAALLLLEGGADALRRDELGETPRDAALGSNATALLKVRSEPCVCTVTRTTSSDARHELCQRGRATRSPPYLA